MDEVHKILDYACQKVMGMPSIEFYNREYASEEGFQMYPDTKEVIKFFINTTLECHKHEIYENYVPFVLTLIQFGRPYDGNAKICINSYNHTPADSYSTFFGLFQSLRIHSMHEPFRIFYLDTDPANIFNIHYGYSFDHFKLLETVKKKKCYYTEESKRTTLNPLDTLMKKMVDTLIEVLETMVDI